MNIIVCVHEHHCVCPWPTFVRYIWY